MTVTTIETQWTKRAHHKQGTLSEKRKFVQIFYSIQRYMHVYTVLIKDVMGRDVSCYTDLVIVHDADFTQSVYT